MYVDDVGAAVYNVLWWVRIRPANLMWNRWEVGIM